MRNNDSIVILDGARRTPRADILIDNKKPGMFSRFSATQLGGLAVKATLERTHIDKGLIGHVIMGMAQQSHRDSIYGAQGMRWRGGLGNDVPALTVARICGSGAEALAVGTPVVSTDCPSGPRETLQEGRFGPLVPVGDEEALARAILETMAHPLDAATLRAAVDEFTVERSADAYLEVLGLPTGPG